MAKYSGNESYKLDYLPRSVRLRYAAGLVSDEEVDSLLEQTLATTRAPNAMDVAVGPLTEQEQAMAQGIEGAGGLDASTSRAAAGASSSAFRDRMAGLSKAAQEGAFIGSVPFAGYGFINEIPAVKENTEKVRSIWQELTGANTEEQKKEDELAQAERTGRSISTALASDRAGFVGKTAIELAPNLTNFGTSIAALIASRNPTLALGIAGASVGDIATQVAGTTYLESRQAGLSVDEATARARDQVGVETLTEMLVPGGNKSASVGKTFLRAVVGGTAQEIGAEAGNMAIDALKYKSLAPTGEEAVERLGQAAKLGAIGTGVIAGPLAIGAARDVANARATEFELSKYVTDPDVAAGIKAADAITKPLKGGKGPEQLELFGATEEMAVQPDLGAKDWKGNFVDRTPAPPRPTANMPRDVIANQAKIVQGLAKDKQAEAAALDEDLQRRQAEVEAGGTPTTQFDRDRATRAQREADRLTRVGNALESEGYTQPDLFGNTPQPEQAPSAMEAAREAMYKRQDKVAAEAKKKAEVEKQMAEQRTAKLRTQAEQEVIEKNPDATEQEFKALVDVRLRQLEAAPAAAPKTTRAQRVKTKKATPAPAPKVEPAAVQKDIEASGIYSLPATAPKNKPTLTREALKKKFIYDESAEGNRFRESLRSGKVAVEQNSANLVKKYGKVASKTEGVYITEDDRVILVADNLTEDTLAGTLQHEVKHRFDKKLGASAPGSMKYIVGDEANADRARYIMAQAKKGNKLAQEIVARYENAKAINPKDTGIDELTAYTISEVAKARKQGRVLGGLRNLTSDVASASRIFLKDKVGLDVDITANDVEYLSRRLVDDMNKGDRAITAAKKKGIIPVDDSTPAPIKLSVVGRNAVGYGDLDTPEFTGPVDKLPRKEISTKSTKVDNARLERMRNGMPQMLKQMFDFPELYKMYPKLANTLVEYHPKVKDKPAGLDVSTSYYDASKQKIVLGARAGATPEEARSVILHELQHAIQNVEGFDPGDNSSLQLSPKEKQELDDSKNVAASALRMLPDTIFNRIKQIGGVPNANDPAAALSYLTKTFEKLPKDKQKDLLMFTNFRRFKEAMDKIKELDNKAYNDYMQNAGETEARLVQARRDMSQEEIDEMPFYETLRMDDQASNYGRVTKTNQTPSKMKKGNVAPAPKFPLTAEDGTDLTYAKDNKFGTEANQLDTPIKRAYRYLKGRVPNDFIEMRDRYKGEANESDLLAMNDLNKLAEAINSSGDPGAAIDRIREMENVGLKDDPAAARAARVALAKKLEKDMPGVFAAYNAARRRIYQMSNSILAEMKKQGYNPTSKELAVINSIEKNLGNYLTTSYKLFGPTKVRKSYLTWLNGTQEGLKVRNAARDWAKNNIYSFTDLEKKSLDYLRAMYEGYIGGVRNADSVSRKDLVAALSQIQNLASTKEATEKLATDFVTDMLAVGKAAKTMGRAASMFRSGTQDMTIITPKKEVPEVLRQLWGEQDNPVMNVFATLVRQGQFLAKVRSQFRMKEEGLGKYLFENKASAPAGAVQITGDSHGPLAGMFTSPSVLEFLNQETKARATVEDLIDSIRDENGASIGNIAEMTASFLGRAGGLHKKLAVAFKPINWLLNYGGAVLQLASNGNFTGKYTKKGHQVAFMQAPTSAYKTWTDEQLAEMSGGLLEAIRNGVLDNSLAGEIQTAEKDAIMQGLLSTKEGVPSVSKMKKSWAMVTDLYSGTDVWAKVANYFYEKDFVTAYHKAAGNQRTPEQLEREAAERVRKTNFTYDRAYRPAKLLEKAGVTNYLTYNAETIRTQIGNLQLGIKDLVLGNKVGGEAGKLLKVHGTKRLAGVAVSSAMHYQILSGIASVLGSAFGAPDEDEKEEQIKKGLPDYLQNSILRLVGIGDDGSREYFDVGRVDPYGPLNNILNAVFEADPDKLARAASGMIIWNQVLTESIEWAKAAATEGAQRPKPPRLSRVSASLYEEVKNTMVGLGMSPEAADRSMRASELFIPSFLQSGVAAMLDSEDKDPARRLYEAAGGNFFKYEPKAETENAGKYNMAAPLTAIRNDWSGWTSSQKDISDEDVAAKYQELASDQVDAWARTRERVVAAELAGYPRRLIQQDLKDAGLNGEEVSDLLSGKFAPTFLSDKKLDGDMQAEIDNAKDAAKVAAIKEKYRKLRRSVAKARRNFRTFEEAQ